MKDLPIYISSFDTMRAGNYIYVDKTEYIYNLFKTGLSHYYFLSRPRRFGKTLLIWTLKEFFSGNRALFKDLWIDKSDYPWIEYPIIHLDFSVIEHATVQELKENLSWRLEKIAKAYGVDLSDVPTLGLRFSELIERLADKNIAPNRKVVILIDEYDKPILDNLADLPLATELQKFLRGFYDTVKSMSHNLRAVFITGVSKFSKTSLFSGLNNLNDITLDPRAASLLGYTDEEVDQYFGQYIEGLAQYIGSPQEVVRQDMRTWYNGYRFSEQLSKVYNPFSILYLLEKRKFENYWFESGTPSFLIDLLKKQYSSLEEVTEFEISPSSLGTFDLEHIPLIPLLFQTGYITISDYNQQTNKLKLDYPNFEVEESLKKYIVTTLSYASASLVDKVIAKLRKALKKKDLDYLCSALEQLLAQIPYTLHIERESYYHSLFHFLMNLLSLQPQSEMLTNKGRIDTVVALSERIYIFELKLNVPAKKALEQILEKQYYQCFLMQPKLLVLVGLAFNLMPDKIVVTYAAQDVNPEQYSNSKREQH
jgi:hypothetical protein